MVKLETPVEIFLKDFKIIMFRICSWEFLRIDAICVKEQKPDINAYG